MPRRRARAGARRRQISRTRSWASIGCPSSPSRSRARGSRGCGANPGPTSPRRWYDGRDYGPIGLRLKGQESFEPVDRKPSLRINIDEYAPDAAFFGLKDLTLNNMHGDYSMMHERLAYWVARQAGVPASRANHALLTVNGRFYGLYTNLETVKKRLMKRWFGDGDGTLYRPRRTWTSPATFLTSLSNQGPTIAAAGGLANALTAPSGDEAIAAAAVHRRRRVHALLGVCAVVGAARRLPVQQPGRRLLSLRRPDHPQALFLPWGMDETFYSSSHDVTQVFSVMARKCKDSPGCYQQFVSQTIERADVGRAARLAGRARSHRRPDRALRGDGHEQRYTNDDVARHQSSMRHFVSERRARLVPMLPSASR